jgi:hypothetical protein
MPYRASLLPDIRTLPRSFYLIDFGSKAHGVRRNIDQRR